MDRYDAPRGREHWSDSNEYSTHPKTRSYGDRQKADYLRSPRRNMHNNDTMDANDLRVPDGHGSSLSGYDLLYGNSPKKSHPSPYTTTNSHWQHERDEKYSKHGTDGYDDDRRRHARGPSRASDKMDRLKQRQQRGWQNHGDDDELYFNEAKREYHRLKKKKKRRRRHRHERQYEDWSDTESSSSSESEYSDDYMHVPKKYADRYPRKHRSRHKHDSYMPPHQPFEIHIHNDSPRHSDRRRRARHAYNEWSSDSEEDRQKRHHTNTRNERNLKEPKPTEFDWFYIRRERAATLIQKRWRGYHVRSHLEKYFVRTAMDNYDMAKAVVAGLFEDFLVEDLLHEIVVDSLSDVLDASAYAVLNVILQETVGDLAHEVVSDSISEVIRLHFAARKRDQPRYNQHETFVELHVIGEVVKEEIKDIVQETIRESVSSLVKRGGSRKAKSRRKTPSAQEECLPFMEPLPDDFDSERGFGGDYFDETESAPLEGALIEESHKIEVILDDLITKSLLSTLEDLELTAEVNSLDKTEDLEPPEEGKKLEVVLDDIIDQWLIDQCVAVV